MRLPSQTLEVKTSKLMYLSALSSNEMQPFESARDLKL